MIVLGQGYPQLATESSLHTDYVTQLDCGGISRIISLSSVISTVNGRYLPMTIIVIVMIYGSFPSGICPLRHFFSDF